MKKGDIVKIYEDPITKTKIEGKAKLLKLINKNEKNYIEHWSVKFLIDGYICDRFIACSI